MKAFLLQVTIAGTSGSGMVNAKTFFGDEKTANEEVGRQNELTGAIIQSGKIVIATPDGPRAVCTVKDLMGMLGIIGVAHTVTSGEVKGSIDVPSSRIILPNN